MPNKTLLIIAVALGAVAVVALNIHISRIRASAEEQMVMVIRVSKRISAGTTIATAAADSFSKEPIAASEGRIVSDLIRYEQLTDELRKQPFTHTLEPGTLLRWDDVRWATQPSTVMLVAQEHSAVSFATNPLSTYGGLILPGDIVDVYISGESLGMGESALMSSDAAERSAQGRNQDMALPIRDLAEARMSAALGSHDPIRVLDDVRVIAVGQITADTIGALGSPRGQRSFASVTLAVRDEDLQSALKLAFAGRAIILVYQPPGEPEGGDDPDS